MASHSDAALPLAHLILRILIAVNWLYGAAVLGLLAGMTLAPEWTLTALGIRSAYVGQMLPGMMAIAVLGLLAVPLNHAVLGRLLAIVETVRAGDAFVPANADRLQEIGWALLGLQFLSIIIGGIGEWISSAEQPLDIDAGFSITGSIAVLFAFVLARVFAEGTAIREDVQGTI